MKRIALLFMLAGAGAFAAHQDAAKAGNGQQKPAEEAQKPEDKKE